MKMRKKRRNIDNSLDILKMEYQVCRSKIDDFDNFLKDIRFKGVSIIIGLISGNGVLLNLEYLEANIIVSISIILLITQLWKYDHKYNMFFIAAVERAREIETKFQEMMPANGTKNMLSHKLTEEYRKLPKNIAITSTTLYSLLIIIDLGILIYSTFPYWKENLWLSVLPIILISIIIMSILLIIYMWHLRKDAEHRFNNIDNQKSNNP